MITQWQKDSGRPVALLNLRIAAMMLAGALARITDPNGETCLRHQGGVAMELRMGNRARATRDVDLIMRGHPTRLTDLLDAGLREPYRGFTFARGALDDLAAQPAVEKARVQVSFAGRSLTTLQVAIAPPDTGEEEFAQIAGANLAAVGLQGPDVVLVLAERWQIAQKVRAVSETFSDGRESPRFRDMIDLRFARGPRP